MLGVDTNAVLIVAVVSEHLAVITSFLGGLVVSLLESMSFDGLVISLLECISTELSAVVTEGRSNKSGDAEATDDVPTTSTE